MREALSFRFPIGTRERLARLARAGETQIAVILRALDVLEGSNAGCDTPAIQIDPIRLEAIETRLAVLEQNVLQPCDTGSDTDPRPPGDRQHAAHSSPSERDQRILELAAAGTSKRGIARQLGIGETTVRRVLGRRSG